MRPENAKPMKRFLVGLFTCSILFACVGGALAYFGPALSWPASLLPNPFVWDAPAQSMARVQTAEKEAQRSMSMTVVDPNGEVVVLDDWNYTAIVRGRPQPSQ